jgi:hypothetical protein
MLLLLQAAQQLPPINVTVLPPAGGMPEWLKILISAGVGALFGIVGNVAMEYVRPKIVKRQRLREMAAQLVEELISNVEILEAVKMIVEDVRGASEIERKRAEFDVTVACTRFKSDRYAHYVAEEKITFYELRESGSIKGFYDYYDGMLREILTVTPERWMDQYLSGSTEKATRFIEAHRKIYAPGTNLVFERYKRARDQRAESSASI